ncbi:hypothetical protein AYI70_g8033 [Smittium culicis]|uniref:Uncharacterized protein n=2 Tax=Smittium culicis TaxID=133412 RepID=A0A1R1XHR8_9FUNG|nr:hypothetical protein AYI70_g8033 [Smittium culicis]
MAKESVSLPKGWYWEVQPAKFVLEQLSPRQNVIVCPSQQCQAVGRFIKDSNGTGRNQKAFLRCGACRDRYTIVDFYVRVLKGSESNLPAATGLDSLLPPPDPQEEIDPAEPIPVDPRMFLPASQRLGTSASVDSSSATSRYPTGAQLDTATYLSDSDEEMVTDRDYDAAMDGSSTAADIFKNFRAVKLPDTSPIKSLGSVSSQANTVSIPPSQPLSSASAFKTSFFSFASPAPTAPNATPSMPAPSQSSTNFGLNSASGPSKRSASPSARSSKRSNTSGNLYVTSLAFNNRMDLHLANLKALIASNRTADLARIQQLEDENKHLKEQLLIQTKRIDRLTQQSKKTVQPSRPQASQPPALTSTTQPINFNFGSASTTTLLSAQPTPAVPPAFKKLSYSEIAKSQSKTKMEAKQLTQSIRKLVGSKPINSGTMAEKNHKLARIYVQGISRQRIKDIKGCLFDMRFQLSKIYNLDFIGKRMLEFTVTEEYAPAFCARVKAFEFLKLMPKVNPAEPNDRTADEETKAACRTAYINRLKKSIEKATKPEIRQYMTELLAEVEASVST